MCCAYFTIIIEATYYSVCIFQTKNNINLIIYCTNKGFIKISFNQDFFQRQQMPGQKLKNSSLRIGKIISSYF